MDLKYIENGLYLNCRVKKEFKMEKTISKHPVFQPVVLDDNGKIRERFNSLYTKTRIEKRALASKIFDVGMKILEKKHQ